MDEDRMMRVQREVTAFRREKEESDALKAK